MSLDIHSKFTFAGIEYDAVNGTGAVPNNSNVLYLEFAAILSVDDYLSLAKKGDHMKTAKEVADKIIDEGVAIGTPFLGLDFGFDENRKITEVYVSGHEGRARSKAIKMLAEGYRKDEQKSEVKPEVVVNFFLGSGLRSRNLNEEFFSNA